MLQEIRLSELQASPTNPRKTFDVLKLEELSRSIAEVGVLEPILVRPYPALNPAGKNPNRGLPKFEVVAGERRYRAAKMAANGNAETATVPCIVRDLTDVQVLEIQIIENNQRDDVHPLEEAAGYAALMKEAGYDVAAIADRIGRSEKYVYDRLKLLQLIPELQTVFIDGEITAGHAILLARLTAEEQRKILGDTDGFGYDRHQIRTLFQYEYSRDDELDLDDEREPRKAISVRELDRLIDDTVRFRPEEIDLPNLFPATAAALAAAKEEELKIVKITRSYRVNDEARDEAERTYGAQSWKRADGKPDTDHEDHRGKPDHGTECEHSVLGIVVAGSGRGQSFKVCVAKKKCSVHWPEEVKVAQKAKKAATSGSKPAKPTKTPARVESEWEKRQREKDAEQARWKKAAPQLRTAIADAVTKAPPTKLAAMVVDSIADYTGTQATKKAPISRGKTIEDGIRFAAYLLLGEHITEYYIETEQLTKALKAFGVDAKKIVNDAAPKEKPAEKKDEPKKDGRKAAGARAAAAARKAKAGAKR
jgi:ParB/RepB/Spo0J family partition protein